MGAGVTGNIPPPQKKLPPPGHISWEILGNILGNMPPHLEILTQQFPQRWSHFLGSMVPRGAKFLGAILKKGGGAYFLEHWHGHVFQATFFL